MEQSISEPIDIDVGDVTCTDMGPELTDSNSNSDSNSSNHLHHHHHIDLHESEDMQDNYYDDDGTRPMHHRHSPKHKEGGRGGGRRHHRHQKHLCQQQQQQLQQQPLPESDGVMIQLNYDAEDMEDHDSTAGANAVGVYAHYATPGPRALSSAACLHLQQLHLCPMGPWLRTLRLCPTRSHQQSSWRHEHVSI